MFRDLPRGQFGAYLRTHYLSDKPNVLPRFSMGCGAIFMIQRVKPLETSLAERGVLAETDPLLLEEMVSLVAAQQLEVVSLAEMRRRLQEGDLERRFVCFTFDGAFRSIKDRVFPLFRKQNIPFALYVGSDMLQGGGLPWWQLLEMLISQSERVTLEIGGDSEAFRCCSFSEQQHAFSRLFHRLSLLDRQTRNAILDAAMKKHGVRPQRAAERELLSHDELCELARSELVTIGSLAGGTVPLSEMSYDFARENVEQSLGALGEVLGEAPKHFAFPGGLTAKIAPRDVEIIRAAGLETAATNIEGALWPEHGRDMLALPRIALNNDPATLVRALMLSGGQAPRIDAPFRKQAV